MEELEPKQERSQSPSSPSTEELVLPKKPVSQKLGAPIEVLSNFYPVVCNTGGRAVLFEYIVKTSPNLTCHTMEDKLTMWKLVRKQEKPLEDLFDNYIYFEGYIYSFERVEDDQLLSNMESKQDGIDYFISIEFHWELTFHDKNVSLFFRTFLNQLLRKA